MLRPSRTASVATTCSISRPATAAARCSTLAGPACNASTFCMTSQPCSPDGAIRALARDGEIRDMPIRIPGFRSLHPGYKRSPAVIWVAGDDGYRPVELLQRHHAHQLMRPGGRAESDRDGGLVAERRGEPIGAADDERHGGLALLAPVLQMPRE